MVFLKYHKGDTHIPTDTYTYAYTYTHICIHFRDKDEEEPILRYFGLLPLGEVCIDQLLCFAPFHRLIRLIDIGSVYFK